MDIAHLYRHVFQVLFVGGDSEMFELDVEPTVREAVQAFWKDSSKDYRITCRTLDDDQIQFECHDVLDFSVVDTSSPEYHLLTPVRLRIFEFNGELLYEADEQDILGVICLK